MVQELTELRKELAKQRRMNEILKNGGIFQHPRVMRFECVQQREGTWPVSEMCDCFEVNASSYYACRNRDPSARSQANEGLECGRDRPRRFIKENKYQRPAKEGLQAAGHR